MSIIKTSHSNFIKMKINIEYSLKHWNNVFGSPLLLLALLLLGNSWLFFFAQSRKINAYQKAIRIILAHHAHVWSGYNFLLIIRNWNDIPTIWIISSWFYFRKWIKNESLDSMSVKNSSQKSIKSKLKNKIRNKFSCM